MEKIVEQGLLYDFYGALLNEHQQRIYEKVVYENLSLNEIAQEDGISRQAVHDLFRRSTATMKRYDGKLGLIDKFRRIEEDTSELAELCGHMADEGKALKAAELIEKIRRDMR